MQCIDITEGLCKTLIIFIRQPGDQVEMLMYVSFFLHSFYNPLYFLKVHLSADFRDRLRIGGLDSDLQLDQPRTHGRDQLHLLFI